MNADDRLNTRLYLLTWLAAIAPGGYQSGLLVQKIQRLGILAEDAEIAGELADLVDEGLIEEKRDPLSPGVKHYHLTAKGRQVLNQREA